MSVFSTIITKFADATSELKDIQNKLPNSSGEGFGASNVQNIFNWLYGMAAIAAIIIIIYGGFMMVTSAGNASQVAKGKQAITYAVVGLAIVILAAAITAFIINTVSGAGA